MSAVRVLVVEDSPTVRRYLCDALSADPDLRVVGEASDGETAISLCQSLAPDVITMDMVLDGASGLTATQHIMTHQPTPILVVSSSTNRGELVSTYEALAAGAVDVLEKPDINRAIGEWEEQFRTAVKIVAKVRAIRRPRVSVRASSMRRTPPTSAPEVIAIGTSTGGPTALVQVLGALPKAYPVPIVVVLHIAEAFAQGFVEWLDSNVAIHTRLAREGEAITSLAGNAVLAPPDRHLVIRSRRLHLDASPERHSCRPSVDALFESVAASGLTSVGCLLTGMGRDGAGGLARMRAHGSLTIAQDEASCAVFGMPREAILLGAATHVLALKDIGAFLASIARPLERVRP